MFDNHCSHCGIDFDVISSMNKKDWDGKEFKIQYCPVCGHGIKNIK